MLGEEVGSSSWFDNLCCVCHCRLADAELSLLGEARRIISAWWLFVGH